MKFMKIAQLVVLKKAITLQYSSKARANLTFIWQCEAQMHI